jgi:hypothetical protein
MPTLRRLAVLLFLITLLAAPWTASAAGPRAERHSRSAKAEPVSTILSRAWTLLAEIWSKEGCGIDPSGRCIPTPAPTSHSDIGCGIDLNGRCVPSPVSVNRVDTGCNIDPDGRCHL